MKQVFFTYLIASYLIEDEFSEEKVQSLMQWRISEGHDFDNIAMWDGVPVTLARQVCEYNNDLIIAHGQAETHAQLMFYLEDASGPALCCFAVCVWFLTVVQEVRAAARLLWAVMDLPRGSGRLMSNSDDKQQLFFTSASAQQKCMGVVLALMRIAIAGCLAFFGGQYLVRTMGLGERLLNMHACMHAHVHTGTRAHMHTCIFRCGSHGLVRAQSSTCVHTPACTPRACAYACMHICVPTGMHTGIPTYTHAGADD